MSVAARRFGHAVAIGINLLILLIVNNLLDFGWFPWLTEDFEELLPLINVAIAVNIGLSLIYMFTADKRVRTGGQILANVLALYVLVRTWQVFPFDFTGYDFEFDIADFTVTWDTIARIAIGLGVFGTSIAIITEFVSFFREPPEETISASG